MHRFRLPSRAALLSQGLAGLALAGALAMTALPAVPAAAQEENQEIAAQVGADDEGVTTVSIPGGAPATHDSDRDGLSDAEEMAIGLNPYSGDTDNDGLGDEPELYDRFYPYVTDPTLPDTDRDGLIDGAEVFAGYGYATDPSLPDTDFDGRTDSAEIFYYGSNPLVPDRSY